MDSLASLILWLLAGALIVQLITHGPGGPTRWIKAKFLGEES